MLTILLYEDNNLSIYTMGTYTLVAIATITQNQKNYSKNTRRKDWQECFSSTTS